MASLCLVPPPTEVPIASPNPPPLWARAVHAAMQPLFGFLALLCCEALFFYWTESGRLAAAGVLLCPTPAYTSSALRQVQAAAAGVAAGSALMAACVASSKSWRSGDQRQLSTAPAVSAFILGSASFYWGVVAGRGPYVCAPAPGPWGADHVDEPARVLFLLVTAPAHIQLMATLTSIPVVEAALTVLADIGLLCCGLFYSLAPPKYALLRVLAFSGLVGGVGIVTSAMRRWVGVAISRTHDPAAASAAASLAYTSVLSYYAYLVWWTVDAMALLPPAVCAFGWPLMDVGIKTLFYAAFLVSGWVRQDEAVDAELQRRNVQLAAADAEAQCRSRFIQFATHELRQPANCLLMGVEELCENAAATAAAAKAAAVLATGKSPSRGGGSSSDGSRISGGGGDAAAAVAAAENASDTAETLALMAVAASELSGSLDAFLTLERAKAGKLELKVGRTIRFLCFYEEPIALPPTHMSYDKHMIPSTTFFLSLNEPPPLQTRYPRPCCRRTSHPLFPPLHPSSSPPAPSTRSCTRRPWCSYCPRTNAACPSSSRWTPPCPPQSLATPIGCAPWCRT